ncbi:MAG: hypothetical protein CMK42_07795 [Porticoccaceae bacterium]|nr:hypothetical protein [Porticoccaceae bacterium]
MSTHGAIIFLYGINLQTTTNVSGIYPGRQHTSDNFFASDFTLQKLRAYMFFRALLANYLDPSIQGDFHYKS